MPRFYFDVDDGERRTVDDEGMEVPSLQEAKRRAIAALPEIARDVLPDNDKHVVAADVRDESGRLRIRATLSLLVEEDPT